MRFIRNALGGTAVAVALLFSFAAVAAAHADVDAGSYHLAIGWVTEPTYVGEINAVQLLVFDENNNPVTDLGPDDVQVVVSAGGQDSAPLTFSAAFDAEEGLGTPGDYHAPLIPTIAGDYSFHVTGTIHGQAIDATVTSGEATFDTPMDPSAIQFPNKVPAVADLATRIDRVDSRSSSDAQTALYAGVAVGLVGIVIGVIALAFAYRNRPRSA